MPSGSKASPNGLTWPWVTYSACEPSGRIRYVFPEFIEIGCLSLPGTCGIVREPVAGVDPAVVPPGEGVGHAVRVAMTDLAVEALP